jgi:hypothetical protein
MTTAVIFTLTMALGQSLDLPNAPATPAPVLDLLYAQTFTLDERSNFDWRKDQPSFKAGTIMVIAVESVYAYPRQSEHPTLFVGDSTAMFFNHGWIDGEPTANMVIMVPGTPDLTKEPIWFGTPYLPEQVGPNIIAEERAIAEKYGITPFDEQEVKKAVAAAGGKPFHGADMMSIYRHTAHLVLQYSDCHTDIERVMPYIEEK